MAKKYNPAFHQVSLNRMGRSKLIEIIKDFAGRQKDIDALRQELQGMANRALKEEFGTFIATFDAMLTEHRVMKKLIMDKLEVTLEEWNKTYKEIKDKQKK